MGIRKGLHACNLPFPLFPCNIHTTGEGGREGPTGHSRKCVAVLCCCCSPHVYEHFPFLPLPLFSIRPAPSPPPPTARREGKQKEKRNGEKLGPSIPAFLPLLLPTHPRTYSEGTAGREEDEGGYGRGGGRRRCSPSVRNRPLPSLDIRRLPNHPVVRSRVGEICRRPRLE